MTPIDAIVQFHHLHIHQKDVSFKQSFLRSPGTHLETPEVNWTDMLYNLNRWSYGELYYVQSKKQASEMFFFDSGEVFLPDGVQIGTLTISLVSPEDRAYRAKYQVTFESLIEGFTFNPRTFEVAVFSNLPKPPVETETENTLISFFQTWYVHNHPSEK